MPCSYEIYPKAGLIWNKLSGRLVVDDIIQLSASVRTDQRFHPSFSILQDMRGHTSDDITYDEMKRITGDIKAHRPSAEFAFYCTFIAPDDVPFGMARMFQSLMADADNAQVFVCRSCEEAAESMGLSQEMLALLKAAELG